MGIGALVGEAMARAGLDKKMVDEIKSELTPRTSALLLIGVEGDADEMTRAFEPYHPTKVMRFSISDDTVQRLKEAQGTASHDDHVSPTPRASS